GSSTICSKGSKPLLPILRSHSGSRLAHRAVRPMGVGNVTYRDVAQSSGMTHRQKTDALMTTSRTLAAEITSFLSPARRWLTILGVSVLLVAFLLASPIMLGEYAQQILSQAFFFAIAAVTVDLLWGYTGVLTFGQSAFFGVGVYTVALALAYYVEGALGMAAAILGAMVAAALIGAAIGWLS